MMTQRQFLKFEHLHQPGGWLSPAYLTVTADGMIESAADRPPADWAFDRATAFQGFAIPGMPNVHSHAFQRAFAGLAESAAPNGSGVDSFWTWRERMYGCAERVDADQFETIAAMVQVEMLEAGMTAVGEFHYLHHDKAGRRFANHEELGRRLVAATDRTGIGMTLLPVLYLHGGFGQSLTPRQARFAHAGVDDFLALWDRLAATAELDAYRGSGWRRLGVAPHSLRAVSSDEIRSVTGAVFDRDADARVHIHIAEQQSEVDACLAALGARPIEYLLDQVDVDSRFCLVHATHCTAEERAALIGRSAVVGLCPTTEANLGDGVFPVPEFLAAGGRMGIGTDSQVSVSTAEELRWVEYQQRLLRQLRNVCAEPGGQTHVGRRLFDSALVGGAQAVGQPIGELSPGHRADVVVLNADHPRLCGHDVATVLDAFVFSQASGQGMIRDVLVAGQARVVDGHHVHRDAVAAEFKAVMNQLMSGS